MEVSGSHVFLVGESDDIYVIDPERLRDVAKGGGWSKFRLDAVK